MEQYLSILNDKFLRKRIKREIEILHRPKRKMRQKHIKK